MDDISIVNNDAVNDHSNKLFINPKEVSMIVEGTSKDLNPLTNSYGTTVLHEFRHTKAGGGSEHSDYTLSHFGALFDMTVIKDNTIRDELTQSTGTNFGHRSSYIAMPLPNGHSYIPMSVTSMFKLKEINEQLMNTRSWVQYFHILSTIPKTEIIKL